MIEFAPLPMKEAEQFWRDKVKLGPGEFAALSREARLKAFAVSGIARGDELSTVFEAIQKAISKGTTFDEFKNDCGDIFDRRGWTGKRAWRVDNIFRTNIQTAYNAGRYKQMTAVKKARPYWQYSAVNDRRTRPTHAAMHGKVYPADHPFWNTWYPPNGYRCRCGVVTLSQEEVDAGNLKVESADPTGRLIEPVDPVTGAKYPARLLMPDAGFAHNPGKVQWGGMVDAGLGREVFDDLPNMRSAADYGRRSLTNVRAAEIPAMKAQPLPGKQSDAFYKDEFKRLYGEDALLEDPLGEPVILSLRSFLVNKAEGAPESWKFKKAGHGESIPLLREMVEAPFEVWLIPQVSTAGRVRLTKRYVSLWKTADKQRVGGLAVFEVADGVFQGVTSFLPMEKGVPDIGYLDKQRKGLLLYKRKGQ